MSGQSDRRVTITFDPPAEENWDTYGGDPTTDAAIAVARAVNIVPTAHGGIQVEIHAGGSSVEIEYDAHGRLLSAWNGPDPALAKTGGEIDVRDCPQCDDGTKGCYDGRVLIGGRGIYTCPTCGSRWANADEKPSMKGTPIPIREQS